MELNMIDHITAVAQYVLESFLHTWPYLLITIPIAVAVKMSGASKYINRAFTARPIIAITLATLVGAFSPLCSCSVIPVIAALLIGGVPLAPVMSFWLASPSMDPEIFFLSVSTLGWELAVWRLATTLVLSLGGGFITHFAAQRGWFGTKFLRRQGSTQVRTVGEILKGTWQNVMTMLDSALAPKTASRLILSGGSIALTKDPPSLEDNSSCGCSDFSNEGVDACEVTQTSANITPQESESPFWKSLVVETWVATTMVIKFMVLAWLIGALIHLYVPETWITTTLGGDKPWAIITAALLGIPVYTSNLTAMPLVGGLLRQGMHPAAALAFLIAGPTTTLPAMSAVWGLVNRKVFTFYIGLSLVGAIVLGYFYGATL
jgi:uncharacterized membrane protein YraQ (UPF0718 family)